MNFHQEMLGFCKPLKREALFLVVKLVSDLIKKIKNDMRVNYTLNNNKIYTRLHTKTSVDGMTCCHGGVSKSFLSFV